MAKIAVDVPKDVRFYQWAIGSSVIGAWIALSVTAVVFLISHRRYLPSLPSQLAWMQQMQPRSWLAPSSQPSTAGFQLPSAQGFVSDFAHVVDAATASKLSSIIGNLSDKTGAGFDVVTVNSTGPLSASTYASKISEEWSPGTPGRNNGVVFLMVVNGNQAQWVVQPGTGLRSVLTDAKIHDILDRQAKPYFDRRDYAGAILVGTEAMTAVISGNYRAAPGAPKAHRQAAHANIPKPPERAPAPTILSRRLGAIAGTVPSALGASFVSAFPDGLARIDNMIDHAAATLDVTTSATVVQAVASLESLPRPQRMKSASARDLNTQGIDALKRNDPSTATAAFEAAHEKNPCDIEITDNLGYAYLESNRLDAAAFQFALAILMSPRRVTSWNNIGQVYALRGDLSAATACFATALSVSTSPDATKRFYGKLQNENPHSEVRTAAAKALEWSQRR